MRTKDPDVVVVGAGIAGASIAAVLARGGLDVLLLERQRSYRDHVRGEYMAPWGVLEARALGLENVMRGTHAVDARYSVPYDELFAPSVAEEAKADTSTILQGVRGPLCASHPRACQALGGEAVRLGAELECGVADVRVQAGARPSIAYRTGTEIQVRPRLIIGADGRAPTVRKQSGIHIQLAPATHVVAGMLVEEASRWPDDQYGIGSKETFSSTSSRRAAVGYACTRATRTSRRHGGLDVRDRGASCRHLRGYGPSRAR